MAELTYEQLRHKNLAELREIAQGSGNEIVQGYTQMNKEHLVGALAKALGIQHEHHSVIGIDKSSTKARKTQREAALASHDHAQLKVVRRSIHRLKRRIHKATV
jgi:hypothetical protein